MTPYHFLHTSERRYVHGGGFAALARDRANFQQEIMRTPRGIYQASGFSTLEMLIAMTVLLMAFTATMMLLPGIQNNTVDTQIAAEALNVAQKMLEQEQARARKDFKLVVPTTTQETITGTTYQKQLSAVSTDYFTKNITAVVSWGGMYNRAQSITLKSTVSNFEENLGGDTCDSILAGNWGSPQKTDILFGSLITLNSGNDSAGLYPLSDLEVFRKRAYVSVAGTSQTAGANSPLAATTQSLAGSSRTWSSPSNALTNNSSYASSVMSGTAATNYLRASTFNFNIPKGATILGITVQVDRNRTSGSGTSVEVIDNEVKIVKANGTLGTLNKAVSSNWPTSDAIATYGSASDLWGEKWTASDINNNNFGIVLSAKGASATGNNRTAQVDSFTITVSYVRQFYAFDVTTPASPTRLGELTANVAPVATGFNAIAVATSTSFGSYAFAATKSTATHMQSIDVSGVNPTIVANYTVPNAGSVTANTIFFKDGYAYLGLEKNSAGGEFIIVDVHNPVSIPAPLATYEINAGVNSIYVKDGYAFLGTDDSNRELVVLNLNNLASPALRGFYDASGATGSGYGKNLYTVGDTLYFGRYYNLTNGLEFLIMNTAVTTPTLLGSYDVGPNSSNPFGVYGLIVRDYLAFLLTGSPSNGGKFQVLNVQNANNITVGATLTLPNGGSGIALDCESNTFFAVSVPTSGSNQNKGSLSIITAP
jgi:type II secretory pathway pseudopilin PulG